DEPSSGVEHSPPTESRPAWAASTSPEEWRRSQPSRTGDPGGEWRQWSGTGEWRSNGQSHQPATGPEPTGATPPCRSDALRPPEPPPLKLVEPTLPEELRGDLGYQEPSGPPPLRLVETPGNGIPRSAPPVSADDDDTLLIFAQTRSAWFSGESEESTWNSELDAGWRAAEQAAQRPTVGERTGAGLPRRVPRANLVP